MNMFTHKLLLSCVCFLKEASSFVLQFMLIHSAWSASQLERNIGSRLIAECFGYIFNGI